MNIDCVSVPNKQRWIISAVSGLLFLVVASPFVYGVVQSVLGGVFQVASSSGCPSSAGLLLHAVVFALLVRGSMELVCRYVDTANKNCQVSEKQKWLVSGMSALVFLVVASPVLFKLVNSLLGGVVQVSTAAGCPTSVGLAMHAVVFMLVVRGIMEVSCKYMQ